MKAQSGRPDEKREHGCFPRPANTAPASTLAKPHRRDRVQTPQRGRGHAIRRHNHTRTRHACPSTAGEPTRSAAKADARSLRETNRASRN